MTGNSVVPVVPQVGSPASAPGQPGYGTVGALGSQFNAGSAGAPSVPVDGFLFKAGPIDLHYQSEAEARNPYAKVNNPPTRGMFTRVQAYLNGIAMSQNKTATGFNNRAPQQRTSFMRNTLPPHGGGYAPETFTPRQLPQSDATYRYNPATGTQQYGTGVLNSDTFGAGQTAGGQGGANYSPAPGPPATYSTASQDIANYSGMPTWG
jgi:hypothetical protein